MSYLLVVFVLIHGTPVAFPLDHKINGYETREACENAGFQITQDIDQNVSPYYRCEEKS